ncbi:MAG: large subunit ribosomal protein L6 [Candidatus Peregrinibacteria bacterium Gr01-1014_25]|nr:MAG: large subunit ribosomal protein L6 [Candidatus Peregrinibacteria bacterium Gr01-1014_25]
MSRIGRKIVAIPSGVTVTVHGATVQVKGPKGEMNITHLPMVAVAQEGEALRVSRIEDTKQARAAHGLTRALIANMIKGVTDGYEKRLEIIGVGFKAQLKGKNLQLLLGFSHPIDFAIPAGIEITQDEKNKNLLTIRGCDKQLVGQTASVIRGLRPPEPYKGKGIRYIDESVRRKVGKAAAGAAAGKAA